MSVEAMKQLRDVHAIQSQDGCWNIDDYMLGLYNGLELALSIMENRKCVFKYRPEASQPQRQAIAKAEKQEPSYWLGHGLQAYTEKPFDDATPLYTSPQPAAKESLVTQQERNFCERCGKRLGKNDWDVHTCTPPAGAEKQEPVAWWNGNSKFATPKAKDWDSRTGGTTAFGCDIPLYTPLPQRQWVGLTDEEVFDVWLNEMPAPDKVFYQKLCRSVEAKLRSKNT